MTIPYSPNWDISAPDSLKAFGKAAALLQNDLKDGFFDRLDFDHSLVVCNWTEDAYLASQMLYRLLHFAHTDPDYDSWAHVLHMAEVVGDRVVARIALTQLIPLIPAGNDYYVRMVFGRYQMEYKRIFKLLRRRRVMFDTWQQVAFQVIGQKMLDVGLLSSLTQQLIASATTAFHWLYVRSFAKYFGNVNTVSLATRNFIATAPERRRDCYDTNSDPWCTFFKDLRDEGVQEPSLAAILVEKAHTDEEILMTVKFVGKSVELRKQIIVRIMSDMHCHSIRYATAFAMVVGENTILEEFLVGKMVEQIRSGQAEVGMDKFAPPECAGDPEKIARHALRQLKLRAA